jgi:hypothetical protein
MPKSYRLLKVGEVIRLGDQFYDGCFWQATFRAGQLTCKTDKGLYRRPIKSKRKPTI